MLVIIIINSYHKQSVSLSLHYPLAGYTGDSVTVTDRCVIGACCTVDTANETLPPGTVITGGDQLKWCREPTTQVKEQFRYLSCYCDFCRIGFQ